MEKKHFVLDFSDESIINYNDDDNVNDINLNEVTFNLQWVEKYRPDDFKNIVSHGDILNALNRLIKNNSLPHLIFYGPPGTGKTTTILTCAKMLYGKNYKNMILELNGSDDRGINVVREQIKDFSNSKQMISNFSSDLGSHTKLVILDEADSMTYDAQFALRRVIENYTSNTRFCLICNYETKIINALKSRCMIFKFSPIPKESHFYKLKEIVKNEKVNITDDGLYTIINLAEGDMRKSINLLQSVYTAFSNNILINTDIIYRQIGYPLNSEKNKINELVFNKQINIKDTVLEIENIKIQFGLTTNDILKELSFYITKNLENTYKQNNNYINMLDKLGNVEIYSSISYNDSLLLANIISIIKNNLHS